MNRQTDRIRRLIELRQREVDAEVAQLTIAQRDVAAADIDLVKARSALAEATEQRRTLALGAMHVEEWRMQEDWLETLAVRQSLAAHRLATARANERRAGARVMLAHKKKKQADALMARLLREAHLKQLRTERRLEDEIAQRYGAPTTTDDDV